MSPPITFRCSELERTALCPGSAAICAQAPPLPENADAASGTRIHHWLTTGEGVLDHNEQHTAQMCQEVQRQVLAKVWPQRDPNKPFDFAWLERAMDRQIGRGLGLTGHPDLVLGGESLALLVDYKTGRNEVAAAADNLQMRGYDVLIASKLDEDGLVPPVIYAAVIQPWAKPQFTLCRYEPADHKKALAQIRKALRAASKPDAPRIPGEAQCRFCPAKAFCPEANAKLAEMVPSTDAPLESLPEDKLVLRLDYIKQAEGMIEAWKAEARRRLESGIPVGDWTLQPGRKTRNITDLGLLYARLKAQGATDEQFTAACKMGIGTLETLVNTLTGFTGAPLEQKVKQLLDGIVETATARPALARKKTP